LSRRVEAVAEAAQGGHGRQGTVGDVLILGSITELSPKRGHRYVKGLRRAVPVLVPHLAHQILSTYSGTGVGSKRSEQIKLLRPERQLKAVEVTPSRGEIDAEGS
jgi:hypothetical protein